MQECISNEFVSGSKTGRAEVMAAGADLAEQVGHLTLQVKRLVAIADARRKRSTLQRRTRRKKAVQQAELKETSAPTTCDVQSVETVEATTFPLSPQQGSNVENPISGETALIDNLTAQLEAAFPQSHDANSPEENAIAARVADLHDRLGGFVKSTFLSV
jgi:hypothetical protein